MTDDVDAAESFGHSIRVANVEQPDVRRRLGAVTVGGGQHHVDPDDLVSGGGQLGADAGSDETGRAGQQHPHGRSNGSSTP